MTQAHEIMLMLLGINCRFEVDRTISFIPPDGEFELMSYRLNTHVIIIHTVAVNSRIIITRMKYLSISNPQSWISGQATDLDRVSH